MAPQHSTQNLHCISLSLWGWSFRNTPAFHCWRCWNASKREETRMRRIVKRYQGNFNSRCWVLTKPCLQHLLWRHDMQDLRRLFGKRPAQKERANEINWTIRRILVDFFAADAVLIEMKVHTMLCYQLWKALVRHNYCMRNNQCLRKSLWGRVHCWQKWTRAKWKESGEKRKWYCIWDEIWTSHIPGITPNISLVAFAWGLTNASSSKQARRRGVRNRNSIRVWCKKDNEVWGYGYEVSTWQENYNYSKQKLQRYIPRLLSDISNIMDAWFFTNTWFGDEGIVDRNEREQNEKRVVRNGNDTAFEMKYEYHTYQELLPTFPSL